MGVMINLCERGAALPRPNHVPDRVLICGSDSLQIAVERRTELGHAALVESQRRAASVSEGRQSADVDIGSEFETVSGGHAAGFVVVYRAPGQGAIRVKRLNEARGGVITQSSEFALFTDAPLGNSFTQPAEELDGHAGGVAGHDVEHGACIAIGGEEVDDQRRLRRQSSGNRKSRGEVEGANGFLGEKEGNSDWVWPGQGPGWGQCAGFRSPGRRIIFSTSAMWPSSSRIWSRAYSSSQTLLPSTFFSST